VPRLAGALILAATFAVIAAVAAVAGHGRDGQRGSGDLVWTEQPHVYRNAVLPNDRILRGVVRNDSVRVVTLTARDLNVRTGDGGELESAAIFAPTFIRGVFPLNRADGIPENEQLRIGLRVRLDPGKTAPVTVSWRERDERASLVDYGTGSLPVPGPLKRRTNG
jgi:hypothetical protein